MEIIINRSELLPLLQTVNGVVERRQPLPILVNLMFSVSENKIKLTASDMEVELIASITKKSKGNTDVTLPAKKLLDICKALPDNASITIKLDGDKALITSAKSRFTLSTLPAHEFPIIEITDAIAEFSITQTELKKILEKTAFSMAQQDVRYYLNGLLLEITKEQIRAVATDGHRLALCDADKTVSVKDKIQISVP